MNREQLVSVPIFTYNGAKFLTQQIESIYAQTYKNIEVIACDDGSSDDTVEILKKYHSSHGLKYYLHKENVGVNKNVSKALSMCKGDFIAPSDQDDIWKPEKIQTLIDNIQDNVLIYSLSTPIDEENKPLDNFSILKENYVQGNNNLAFLFSNCVSGHTIMFKSELLPLLSEIPQSIYPDWWIAFVASSYGKIAFIDKSLVYYRRHSAQLTKKMDKGKDNFFSRIKRKEKNKKKYIKTLIQQLAGFASLEVLDAKTSEYIKQLEIEFKKFFHTYYNKKLEQLLYTKEKELFTIQGKKLHKHKKRFSRGIWYYRARFYI